jgi:hypothetical protein
MLFEWLIERRKPGPVGTIESEPPEGWDGGAGLVRGLIALALLVGWIWVIARSAPESSDRITVAILTVVYLVAAYVFSPQPEVSNLGFFGGLIDHPFRFTDDVNRVLLFLMAFLWPGRLIAAGLVDLVRATRTRH